jgi:hypothetical protein
MQELMHSPLFTWICHRQCGDEIDVGIGVPNKGWGRSRVLSAC